MKKFTVFILGVILLFSSCDEDPLMGLDGNDGQDGLTTLVRITDEPAGANCSNGGILIEVGIDENGNGVLDDEEVMASAYICNGSDGASGVDGKQVLVVTVEEPAGDNCPDGGIKILIGLDTNRNGVLDTEEVSSVSYVCDGRQPESTNLGKTYLILTGDINDEEAAEQIKNDLGSNTQFIWIQNTTKLKNLDLSEVKELVSLRVTNNDSLASLNLAGLEVVYEEFRFDSNIKDINLDSFQKIFTESSNYWDFKGLTELTLPSFEGEAFSSFNLIGDKIEILKLPKLEKGNLELWSLNSLVNMELSSNDLSDLNISFYHTPLTEMDFGFRKIGSIKISDSNQGYGYDINFQNLEEVKYSISIQINRLNSLLMPKLTKLGEYSSLLSGEYSLISAEEIHQLNIESLESGSVYIDGLIENKFEIPNFISGALAVFRAKNISKIILPSFIGGELGVVNCENLYNVAADNLESLDLLSIGQNPMMETLSLPSLKSLGYMSISHNGLSVIEFPNLEILRNPYNAFNSNKLTTETLDHLVTVISNAEKQPNSFFEFSEQNPPAAPSDAVSGIIEEMINQGHSFSFDNIP